MIELFVFAASALKILHLILHVLQRLSGRQRCRPTRISVYIWNLAATGMDGIWE